MADNPAFRLQHEMASAMKGIDFPVDRDQLLEHAKKNKASKDVMAHLETVAEGEYKTVAEVMGAKNV